MSAAQSKLTPESVLNSYSKEERRVIRQHLTKQEQQEVANILDWNEIIKKEASFEAGPLYWLTKFTQTEDEHWAKKGTQPIAPFPAKDYFIPVLAAMLQEPTLFIIKSREMMTSWLACGYVTWMCMTLPQMFWLMQTEKEDKVAQLIKYCRILYHYSPQWMQEKNPLVVDNIVELKWQWGGHILGVPKGENQVRVYHPHGYLQDESAFLPEAEQCFNAVRPVTKQIIAISSDAPGWYHDTTRP
jgi:hypothetical protein